MKPIDERKVLNAGVVALMRVDGDDLSPVQAARTSYKDFVDDHSKAENEGLVDYLFRKDHGTPIEFGGAVFHMVMPIFVARQLIRYRHASINEESLRYVAPRKEFYIPELEECKSQSVNNKQGSSSNLIDDPYGAAEMIRISGEYAHRDYEALVGMGLSKELARTVLPLGQYTAWHWTANLRGIFHLITQRANKSTNNHAQYQTAVYADAMLALLRPHFPVCIAAFENHVLNSVRFSADEMKLLKEWFGVGINKQIDVFKADVQHDLKKTRQTEFYEKLGILDN